MAKSYHLYEIETFPDFGANGNLKVPSQLALLEGMEVPDTSITMVAPDYHAGFSRCRVHHEMLVHIMGRARGITFNEFIQPFDFEAYIHTRQGFIAFQGKGEVVNDAVDVLNKKLNGFQLRSRELDLKKLLPYITYIKGAWFKMSNPNLAAQALFGDHVDRDPSFERALKLGESMSTIMMNYEYNDNIYLATVLREYGVVFYSNIFTETELELVLDIKRSLLDTAIISTDE